MPVQSRPGTRRSWKMALLALALCVPALLAPIGLGSAAAQQANGDLLQTIDAKPELSTLAHAVRVAGLTDTLKSPGPYTLWAPNNAGFDKLAPSTLDALLANPTQLRELLTYHLAPTPITAAQIVQVPNVRTVEGEAVRISAAGTSVHLNDATVTEADVPATNGIIHVIDGILTPPSQVGSLPATGEASSPALAIFGIGALMAIGGLVLRRAAPLRWRSRPWSP